MNNPPKKQNTTLAKYKENLHNDIASFSEELTQFFPDAVFTSGNRPGAVTKFGKKSRHATGEAIDLRINPEIASYLESEEGVKLLHKYQLGFLDESLKDNQKWGESLHVGRDSTLVERTNNRYRELFGDKKQDSQIITNDVNYLSNNQNMPNFAGVPYVPQEEEKKTEEKVKDKDVEEVQQKTNELNFLDELKTRPIVQEQNTQQQVQAPQYQTPNYIQLYDQISQFTENPVAQQGRQQLSKNEIDFLSEIAVKDNNGYWNKNNHGKVVEIEGNSMATHGYGNIPLYVIPDKGTPKIVYPNTGEHTFKGATKFLEIPIKK